MGLGGKWVGSFYGDILSLRNVWSCMLQTYKKQEFSEEEKNFKHVLSVFCTYACDKQA